MSQTVVVKHTANDGVLAGLMGCSFGLLGIFTFGIVFVPLAAVCSLLGLLRAAIGLSFAGIGCSLLGLVLTAFGFVFSPTLWAIVGAGVLVSHVEPAAPVGAVAEIKPNATQPIPAARTSGGADAAAPSVPRPSDPVPIPQKDAQTAQPQPTSFEGPRPQRANICGRALEYQVSVSNSPQLRGFLGAWRGTWNSPNQLCAGLIVRNIDASGSADILYVYGRPGKDGGTGRQIEQKAQLSADGTLSFQDDQGSSFIFIPNRPGVLTGNFTGRSGKLAGDFRRAPDEPVTQLRMPETEKSAPNVQTAADPGNPSLCLDGFCIGQSIENYRFDQIDWIVPKDLVKQNCAGIGCRAEVAFSGYPPEYQNQLAEALSWSYGLNHYNIISQNNLLLLRAYHYECNPSARGMSGQRRFLGAYRSNPSQYLTVVGLRLSNGQLRVYRLARQFPYRNQAELLSLARQLQKQYGSEVLFYDYLSSNAYSDVIAQHKNGWFARSSMFNVNDLSNNTAELVLIDPETRNLLEPSSMPDSGEIQALPVRFAAACKRDLPLQ